MFGSLLLAAVVASRPWPVSSREVPADVYLVYLDDVSPDCFEPFSALQADEMHGANALPYGAIKTPTIKRLAREGVAFESAFAPAMCMPSRMTLLTGRHAYYHGVYHNNLNLREAPDKAKVALRGRTIYDRLAAGGYRTAAVGKWGVALENNFETSKLWHGASKLGFPEGFKGCAGAGEDGLGTPSRYWQPCYGTINEGSPVQYDATGPTTFGPDLEREFVKSWVLEHKGKGKPLFLYWPMVLVHETIDRRLPVLSGSPGRYAKTETLSTEFKKLMSLMVRRADSDLGALVDVIERTVGGASNALVWVLSDNGSFNTAKQRGVERGSHVVSVAWGGLVRARGVSKALMDVTDVMPTLLAAAGVMLPPLATPKQRRAVARDYSTEETFPGPDRRDGESLWPYLRGETDSLKSFALSNIGGSHIVRVRVDLQGNASTVEEKKELGYVLECANGLLGVASGRLYRTLARRFGRGYERADASTRDPSRKLSPVDTQARKTIEAARTRLGPPLRLDHAVFSRESNKAFLDHWRQPNMEAYHLYSHKAYRDNDESSALEDSPSKKAAAASSDKTGAATTSSVPAAATTTRGFPPNSTLPVCGGLRTTLEMQRTPSLNNTSATVTFMRMRKAASATTCVVLNHHFAQLQVIREMFAFNTACTPLIASPRLGGGLRKHVSVLQLREPLARWVSEYWYRGPGFVHNAESDELWLAWLRKPMPANCRFKAGEYYPNYYLQRLSGECGSCIKENEVPGEEHMVYGCNNSAFCTVKSGVPGPNEKALAMNTLNRFAVVMIVERLEESAKWLISALDIKDTGDREALMSSFASRIDHRDISARTTYEARKPLSVKVEATLRKENAYDTRLYTRATKRLDDFIAKSARPLHTIEGSSK